MNKKSLYLSIIIALGLTGCGSDNNGAESTIPEIPETSEPKHESLTVNIEPNETLEDDITVYLGRWYACNGTEASAFCDSDGRNVIVSDESKYVMTIPSEDLIEEFGGKSAYSAILQDGHFSVLDLMEYVSRKRDDFNLNVGDFDPAIGTYRFTVDFDANGDGIIDVNDPEEYQNPNWYSRFMYNSGEFQREVVDPAIEATYTPTDLMVVRSGSLFRLQPYSEDMTHRREEVQAMMVDRVSSNNDKVVIEKITINVNGEATIYENVEVNSYGMRSDLFKEGVITYLDILLSLNDSLEHDAKVDLSYWPQLSTGANVGSFSIVGLNDVRSAGWSGWVIFADQADTGKDFFNPRGAVVTAETVQANRSYCPWMGSDITLDQAQLCLDDWKTIADGHIMPDVWVMNAPPKSITLNYMEAMWSQWQTTELFRAGDGLGKEYDITKAVAPLTQEHFGWGIADCSLCHSVDNVHLNGDSPSLPGTAEPYYCAQCHSSNGAPIGHGETSRCHWCHSEDKLMTNHGGASARGLANNLTCNDSLLNNVHPDYAGESELIGPCANKANLTTSPIHDKAFNKRTAYSDIAYPEDLMAVGNSDWHSDEQFPDPYSCVTCHPNQ
ncbi:hypothetical protein [Shewanella sp. TC10]|uniref:hypothetical protein n=1 Tax=Shewanella sp. TC10 TaxID=1419739 RepID=UPI00129DF0DB|nr:hypothetical protein [Shewanella sp. TC10]